MTIVRKSKHNKYRKTKKYSRRKNKIKSNSKSKTYSRRLNKLQRGSGEHMNTISNNMLKRQAEAQRRLLEKIRAREIAMQQSMQPPYGMQVNPGSKINISTIRTVLQGSIN
jgi:hypothetical protein